MTVDELKFALRELDDDIPVFIETSGLLCSPLSVFLPAGERCVVISSQYPELHSEILYDES